MTLPRTVWYFGLEPVASRYTAQLSGDSTSVGWMPKALDAACMRAGLPDKTVQKLRPHITSLPADIITGKVLDAVGRGRYALAQCDTFLSFIRDGLVRDGDVIFLQDFWTPGLEAILYALHLHGIQVRLYSMLHAQSVDEYDFTFPMRTWMRGIELGYYAAHSGIFVASWIHRQQLINAGFMGVPIHVVGLPFDREDVGAAIWKDGPMVVKRNVVVYSSRLDAEKQPEFMVAVARRFLAENPHWHWHVTTSLPDLRGDVDGLAAIRKLQLENPHFSVFVNLSKDSYYAHLARAQIQFNCSLQDYVSWTLLEAVTAGCDVVYPYFRSFPEVLPGDRLYEPWKVEDAVRMLNIAAENPRTHIPIATLCDYGRRLTAEIVVNGAVKNFNQQDRFEVNIWKGE